jgi:hypothetical protein
VYWPAVVPAELVWQEVMVGGEKSVVEPVLAPDPRVVADVPTERPTSAWSGASIRVPLGRAFGARSGDKGGNANIGVWARSASGYGWLSDFLTVERLQELLPETAPLPVRRYELPNILALNFVIVGLLGEGVAASSRQDAQAKSLGEWLRARIVDLPADLLQGSR